jgi:anion-transporting  ArsA/GET3 family ATPase
MVLTIDPAKRLANSLGFDQMGGEPTQVDLSELEEATGELWAMMLDSRSTMDSLITAIAPDLETRDRILANHVYRHMADTFAGSQDYMATEKLYDLVSSGHYDMVVLDTPPVKNALDFLESPGRVVNFMDERVLHWFLAPFEEGGGGLSRRFMMSTSAVVYRLLGYVFGKDFLEDLSVFFGDFQGLYGGFRERHAAVLAMLRDSKASFVTVCAPTESSLDVAVFFQSEMRQRDLPSAGVIVNQVHACEGDEHNANLALGEVVTKLAGDLPSRAQSSVLARLGRAHRRLRKLRLGERELVAQVRTAAAGGFYQEIPRLEGEVHDLLALREVGRHLFELPSEDLTSR